ncbi:MAG: hypothetical protein WC661_04365 [Opitutaceae bacterium]|jgi:hypothetical protein
MITNTNNVGSVPTPAPDPRRTRTAPATPAPAQEETLSTAHATQLKAALAETPAVRPEVVERASKLAVDPAYPPIKIINEVARMIANSYDPSSNQD